MRILTNRNFESNKFLEYLGLKERDYEAIEIDDNGFATWKAVEHTVLLKGDKLVINAIESCFPVDIDFINEKFQECGRTFDEHKIPHLKRYPYS